MHGDESLQERQAMCAATVTLNGRPATISGWRLPFAVIRDKATGLSAEWSWPTVARIVANGGAFQS